jgi:DNA invertase Pin-like site-specific DNA recombinase
MRKKINRKARQGETPSFGKFVSLLRVSTKEQGMSGLGIEAQREAITAYLNGGNWELVAEFVEEESGTRAKADRPVLEAALAKCQATGAKLIFSRMDRLTRNVGVLADLLNSGVHIQAVDMPQLDDPAMNKFVLQNLANVAELEASYIAERTRAALRAKRKREPDHKFGSPSPEIGSAIGNQRKRIKADEFVKRVGPVIVELEKYGCMTLAEKKKGLEARGIRTARNKTTWGLSSIRSVHKRWLEIDGKN